MHQGGASNSSGASMIPPMAALSTLAGALTLCALDFQHFRRVRPPSLAGTLTHHGPRVIKGRRCPPRALGTATDSRCRLSSLETVGMWPSVRLGRQLIGVVCRVGKTSLMNQYVNKRFSNQYKATIGADLWVCLCFVANLGC